ncbi:DUF5665 domain-containing protein [Candidatus Gracilibacteria bacterium]|nr:DUF5665 domain-containing protein [Candidatus Gracilibacteria bacterium]
MNLFKRSGKEKHEDDKSLADGFRRAVFGNEMADFVRYLRSPWRIMWSNFLGGMFRGLGFVIGVTVVLALLIWFLTKLVDFPLIGSYFQQLLDLIKQYTPQNGIRGWFSSSFLS